MRKIGLRMILMCSLTVLVAGPVVLFFGIPWAWDKWLQISDPYPNAKSQYHGDGTFYDAGPPAELHRFVIDFGQIDLSKSGKYEYSLAGLPPTKFFPYLVIDYPLPLLEEQRPQSPWAKGTTTIWLKTEDDKEVFRVSGPLHDREWVWSGWIGGNQSELYNMKSRFAPLPSAKYRIGVEIVTEGGESPVAKLQICGGGSHE